MFFYLNKSQQHSSRPLQKLWVDEWRFTTCLKLLSQLHSILNLNRIQILPFLTTSSVEVVFFMIIVERLYSRDRRETWGERKGGWYATKVQRMLWLYDTDHQTAGPRGHPHQGAFVSGPVSFTGSEREMSEIWQITVHLVENRDALVASRL